MKQHIKVVLAAVLLWTAPLTLAQFRGPGGPGHSSPRATALAPVPHVGPRHVHGLPGDARVLWIAGTPYFIAAGTYYLWNAERDHYEVVPAG